MKNRIILILVFICDLCYSQKIDSIAVSKWYNDYQFAVSMTWDDTNSCLYEQVAPLFDRYGVKTTFAITMFPTHDNIFYNFKNLAKNGHEIASHSMTHTDFRTISETSAIFELKNSNYDLYKKIGIKPTTFVYPYYRIRYRDVMYENYLFSRGENKYRDKNAFVFRIGKRTNFKKLKRITLEAEKRNSLVVFAGHCFDDKGWSPVKYEFIDKYLKYLTEKTNVWLTTYQKVSIYNKIRNNINIVSVTKNKVLIDDSLIDYKLYRRFKIKRLLLTLKIKSLKKDLKFKGRNIINIFKNDSLYIVNIDLKKGNQIRFN